MWDVTIEWVELVSNSRCLNIRTIYNRARNDTQRRVLCSNKYCAVMEQWLDLLTDDDLDVRKNPPIS